jgi:RNA polymerase sigma-70 factor (ECF subfamily)
MTLEQEEKIVAQAKKEKRHFNKLYVYYQPKIYSYVYRKLGDKELSEDITSQTFEKALKGLRDFKWQGVSFGVWLYRIARNNINDYLRKLQRKKRDLSIHDYENVIMDEDSESLEDLVVRNEEEAVLYKAISKFKQEDQYLLYYKFFESMSNKEISEKTGLSETNVGTKLHRIRQNLKKAIKEITDEK